MLPENINQVKAEPSKQLLTPDNSVFLFIDQEPQMYFGLGSHDPAAVLNAIVGLAKAAKVWDVPTVYTTVAADSFTGYLPYQQQEVFPDKTPIDRSTLNAWEDERIVDAIKQSGRTKLVVSGMWTEVCLLLPVLSALEQGYEVYVVTDASGGQTVEAHESAMVRMTQAGAIPVTWMQVMLELQRDWARTETYDEVMQIIKDHGGAYGMGVQYAQKLPKDAPR
ncbi:hydrolase [Arthrobacter echini]|uniref:Hydrolase n=1 Tax=Arthrobacter echini TaxID=1529066 RepID=A0A4S5E5N7_9MICC|nr:hydrolase [Arthrobacter echini]THJ66743.1 hydrolase [Arthrobacter echini]